MMEVKDDWTENERFLIQQNKKWEDLCHELQAQRDSARKTAWLLLHSRDYREEMQRKVGLLGQKQVKVKCPDCGAKIPNDGCCWYCENDPIAELRDISQLEYDVMVQGVWGDDDPIREQHDGSDPLAFDDDPLSLG